MNESTIIKTEELLNDSAAQIQAEPERGIKIKDFYTLIIEPAQFFKSGIKLTQTINILVPLFLAGLVSSADKIESKIMQSNLTGQLDPNIPIVFSSWLSFWMIISAVSLVYMTLIWYPMGWWYNIRLKWCSAGEFEKVNGKVVFLYNRLIYVVPSILIMIINMFVYPNFIEVATAVGLWSKVSAAIIFITILVSTYNSYRSVNEIFNVKKSLSRVWFLILPLIVYSFIMGVGVILAFLNY